MGDNGDGLRVAVVAACFNGELVGNLLNRVREALSAAAVAPGDLEITRVPGTHELPYAVNELARSERFHCVVALGVVIAGQTDHHHMIGTNTSRALQAISVSARVPVINGTVVVNDRAQAEARCGGKIDRGGEFARAAVEMGRMAQKFRNERKT